MRLFKLFMARDIRHLFGNPKLIILPLGFFGTSLFLLSFTGALSSSFSTALPLYWTLFILSTTGSLGQIIAPDHDHGFLQSLCLEGRASTPYLLSKGLTLTLGWSLPFWAVLAILQVLEGTATPTSLAQNFGAIIGLSGALAFLYCLFDSLFLEGKRSPLLGLILLMPFMLPLLILSLSTLENDQGNLLIPLYLYALFLMVGSVLLTKKAIQFSR